MRRASLTTLLAALICLGMLAALTLKVSAKETPTPEPTTDAAHPKKTKGPVTSPSPDLPPLFETEFDSFYRTLPPEIIVTDQARQPVDAEIATDNGASVLRIESAATRTLTISGGDQWTDYAVEARVRVTGGALVVTVRNSPADCESYDLYLEFKTSYASIERADEQCQTGLIQDRGGLPFKPGEWVTVRFEAVGVQLSASFDGINALTAINDEADHGFPSLTLIPENHTTALLEIDTLRVVPLIAPPTDHISAGASPGAAIAELQQLGLVPNTGLTRIATILDRVLQSDHYYEALDQVDPRSDIVMGANITYQLSDGDSGSCGLLVRVSERANVADEYLFIGFTDDGYAQVEENSHENLDVPQFSNSADADFPPGKTYHVLAIVSRAQALMYVDGQRAVVARNLFSRQGGYSAILNANDPETTCEIQNLWIYGIRQ